MFIEIEMMEFFSVIGNLTFVKQWRNSYGKEKQNSESGEAQ